MKRCSGFCGWFRSEGFVLSSQFVQDALSKNDSVLQFDSPAVNCSCNIQSLRAVVQLDNVVEVLKGFDYHPDPTFNQLSKNVITETSIIIVTVRGRSTLPPARPSAGSHFLFFLSSGSRFLQGDDGQRGQGVRRRRFLSREHTAGKNTRKLYLFGGKFESRCDRDVSPSLFETWRSRHQLSELFSSRLSRTIS